ncbi:hypothetical protein GF312_22760 [Candidatus Poribacteria bacterium]|nr:hypothetical protein [Candidatus Poribacteria bacterium]
MSSSQQYGILLVTGMKTHQENYANFFVEDPRCKIIAVTDEANIPQKRLNWNKQLAEELNVPYIIDLNEALKLDEVDIVSVCSEHERRGRVTIKCAEAGKHVYIDKPMTCRLIDAHQVVEAVENHGVYSQVFSFIHYPWVRQAKSVVESGEIGDLLSIHFDVMFAKGYPGTAPLDSPRKETPYPQRFTFTECKRELHTTGVYAIGAIRWIADSEISQVFCITSNYFFAEHARNDVEDFAVMALNLKSGVTATIGCGRIGYTSHPAGGPNKITLIGSKASVLVDSQKPRITVCSNEPPWTPPPVDPEDPMCFWQSTQNQAGSRPKNNWVPIKPVNDNVKNDASWFIDYIESGKPSDMTAKDGAATVEVLMAGYLSAAKSKIISLPLPRH